MKLKNLITITIRSMNKVRWKLYLVCFVCICSFFLIDQMASNSLKFIFHKIELERMLQYGQERTLQIQFGYIDESQSFVNKVNKLMDYTSGLEGVYASGSYDGASIYFNELKNNHDYKKINRNVFKNTFRMETLGISEVIYVNPGMEELGKLDLLEGEKDFKKRSNDGICPVLAGYDYKNLLKVGKILTVAGSKNKYEVIGILDKGAKWFGDVDALGTEVCTLDDQFIVARSQNEIGQSKDIMTTLCTLSSSYILLNKDADLDDIEELINQKSKELGLSVTTSSMKNVLKDYEDSYKDNLKISVIVAFIFILFSVISISSATVVSVLLRKSEYGILYANGLSRKDINRKIFLENVYLIFVSVCIAYALRTYSILKNNSQAFKTLLEQIHLQLTLPFLIIISLFIVTLASLPPIMIMNKMKPVELIGGNE